MMESHEAGTGSEQAEAVTPWSFIGTMFPQGKIYSNYAPALAVHAGKMCCLFSDKNRSNGLYYAWSEVTNPDGTRAGWSDPEWFIDAGGQAACEQSALANDDGDVLHAVVLQSAQGHRDLVHYVYEDELEKWEWRGGMVMHSGAAVSIAGFHGQLFCAFSPEGTGSQIYFTVWNLKGGYSRGWGPLVKISEQCTGGPALYQVNDTLHLLFREVTTKKIDDLIYNEALNSWKRSDSSAQPADSANGGVCATGIDDQAFLGFTKSDGSGLVLVSSFANGKWYQTDQDIGGQWSPAAPALAAVNNTVNCAWYDKNSNGELKWAQKPLTGIFPDHWMKEIDGSTKLSALTIPGTHDTCTYTSNRPWVKTQSVSVPHQLDEGIRFLDLRAGLDENVLYLYHGDVRLPGPIRLADIFSQLYAWLDGHVSEAIVVLIKEDPYPVSSPDTTFDGAVSALINANPGYWYLTDDKPALGDVRKKLVLIRRYESKQTATAIGIDASQGWPYDNTGSFRTPAETLIYVQDNFAMPSNQRIPVAASSKFAFVQSLLSVAGNDQEPGTWYLNYTSGYSIPWAYPGALATGMLGLPGWGAFPAGQGVNSKLYGWIAGKRPTVRYGVIVMDFPQQPYGDLIWDIVKANTFMSSAVFEPVQAS